MKALITLIFTVRSIPFDIVCIWNRPTVNARCISIADANMNTIQLALSDWDTVLHDSEPYTHVTVELV